MDLNYHKTFNIGESIVVESQCETNQYHNHNEHQMLKENPLCTSITFTEWVYDIKLTIQVGKLRISCCGAKP